jgi:hypothetical protein
MMSKKGLLILFLAATAAVLNFAVPPFQNPDEPVHFGAVLRVARGADRNAATEKEILRFMDRSNWWRSMGMGRPTVLPGRIGEIPYVMDGAVSADSYVRIRGLLAYHTLAGTALRLAGIDGLETSYYLLRLLSFLLFLAALGFLWSGLGRLARSAGPAFTVAVLLVPLVPQFLIGSIAVSPDMLCVALGAAFFSAAIAVLERRASALHWALAFLSAAIGFATDKSVFILLPLALLLIVFRIDRANAGKALGLVPVLALSAVVLAYAFVMLFPLQAENGWRIVKDSFLARLGGFGALFALDDLNRRFAALLSESFFLRFGGMVFGAGRAIVLAWRALLAIAGTGLALFLAALPFGGRWRRNPFLARVALFAFAAVAVQVFGVRLSASPGNIYAQGRYLFPVMGFAAVLFVIGIRTALDALASIARAAQLGTHAMAAAKTGTPGEGAKAHENTGSGEAAERHISAGVFALKALAVVALFVLTFVIWYRVVPVFHMTITSPYPGI